MKLLPIQELVWNEKYRLKRPDGTIVDNTIEDTFRRVANALSEPEKPERRGEWAEKFYGVMSSFEFLPAGRIIAGAGSGRDVTLMNCYVMGTIEDSLDGIMEALAESAATLKTGGGIGMDFSTLRPRGAPVAGVESTSSGAVSFMGMWDAMCGTIMSAGARRGAMMGILRCDHPDIEEFIAAKTTKGRLSNFNVSVAVTDAFMDAVKSRAAWPLVFGGKIYRTIDAAALWDRITELAYEHAEPGVVFIDRMNKRNPLRQYETFAATNPCGEQPLPPYGACCLGSINLTRLVRLSFDSSEIDWDRLKTVVAIAVRMLDNAIDVSRYPLPWQADEALKKRRIGLGITGLADALIMLGIKYGSPRAVKATRSIMRELNNAAILASTNLGAEKGSFPLFHSEDYDGAPARRNSHVTSIAPTGTISLLGGNVSSGIEPVFAWSTRRKMLQVDGTHRTETVDDYANHVFAGNHQSTKDRGEEWVTSADLTADDHLAMMAACQAEVDSAISKTINCPASTTLEQFRGIYTKAWDAGLKGCTLYREGASVGSVLEDAASKAAPVPETMQGNVVHLTPPASRPDMLKGATYKVRWGEHATYVTINTHTFAGRERPFELFLNSKDVDSSVWRTALSRMVSAVFRRDGDVSFVTEELQAIHDPRGGQFIDGKLVPSLPAAIGDMIHRHLEWIGAGAPQTAVAAAKHCPKCQRGRLVMREGCAACDNCDYSKC